jgi:hypothetical protein
MISKIGALYAFRRSAVTRAIQRARQLGGEYLQYVTITRPLQTGNATKRIRVFVSRSRGENSVGLNVAGMIAAPRPMDFSDRTWCVGQ